MMPLLPLLLSLLQAAVAEEKPTPPAPGSCTPMVSGSCWHNQKPTSHVGQFDVLAANETAAACLCFANCTATPGCVHWHVKAPHGNNEKFECDLRTADVWRGAGTCLTDDNPAPGPAPGPAPPDPEKPYPQPPLPPPGPPPQPALGYKPHLIFHLVDDVGHFNFGWRGNKEARTPHIDSLVAQGLILERQYVFKYCSPTRSSFLSGRLPVHVNTANRGPSDAAGVHIGMSTIADVLSGAGENDSKTVFFLPLKTLNMIILLRQARDIHRENLTQRTFYRAGYTAHQVGKWHAGSSAVGNLPVHRGFTSSLGATNALFCAISYYK